MKKSIFLRLLTMLMVVATCFGTTSCKEDPELYVNLALVNVEANGLSNEDIIVTASNTDWSVDVVSGREWLTAYKNGNKVAISAKENQEVSERSGTIVVTATADTRINHYVTINQLGTTPYITVNGTVNDEHTFPGIFDSGKSGIDYKQVFKIKSNIEWTVNGKVDWLNISPTAGKDEVQLTIYPTSANNADRERTASINLSGSGINATINITQQAGKPVCYVMPTNEIALYDRICWEYNATTNVDVFKWIILADWEYNRMTERDLLNEITLDEEKKYVDEYISCVAYDSHDNMITENSTYYLITLAYDKEGNAGELQKTKIKTPAYLDEDHDAWVYFDNIYADYYSGFMFDAIKEGYCNNYHLIYGIGSEMYNTAIYAFEINYYLKHNKKHWLAETWDMEIVTDYPNNHTFTYNTPYLAYYPICFAYGWGVFKDGKLSSDLVGFQWDTSAEEAMRKAPTHNNQDKPENFVLTRSVETEKAKKMRK